MKLGLTGGIGCGKSTAGTILQQLGWRRIDADALVHDLLDNDPQVRQALYQHFGPEALLPATNSVPAAPAADNTVSAVSNTPARAERAAHAQGASPAPDAPATDSAPRAQGATAGNTAAALQPSPAVNRAFLAARIFSNREERLWLEALLHPRVRQRWETMAAMAGQSPVVVEIPLLFEKNLEKHFDLTVCVEADHHTQLARLQSRTMDPAAAEARIASQMPLAEKIKRADRVLSNNGTEDFFRAQVLRLNHELLMQPTRPD